MKQNKHYSEENLQNLLKNMPKVEDQQTSDELYEKISSRMNAEETPKTPFYKQPWLVTSVSAAAVLIFAIITFSWLMDGTYNTADQNSESANDHTNMERKIEEHKGNADGSAQEGEAGTFSEGESSDEASEEGQPGISSVPENNSSEDRLPDSSDNAEGGANDNSITKQEIGGQMFIDESYVFFDRPHDKFATIALTGVNSSSLIPVTIIAPPNWGSVDEVYNSISRSVHAKDWGVQEYAFKDVTFHLEKDQNTVTANFPEGYQLPQGELEEQNFINALKEMFRPHEIKTINVQRNGERGLTFENMGELEEITIEPLNGRAYLMYKNGEQQPGFLSPVTLEEQTIETAFKVMQEGVSTDYLIPVIPEGVSFTSIEKQDNRLELTFNNGADLGGDPIKVIESILVTAKSFGFTEVKFHNAPKQKYGYGNYQMDKTIPVPDLINPKPFNYPPGTAP